MPPSFTMCKEKKPKNFKTSYLNFYTEMLECYQNSNTI